MKTQTALSIRQPWAWLIIHGFKPIENRSQLTHCRGPLLIHAGQTMTRADYEACLLFVDSVDHAGLRVPSFHDFHLGGIVGRVDLVDCVQGSDSHWFTGPFGWVLANPRPLKFQPCKGSLGFFYVKGKI